MSTSRIQARADELSANPRVAALKSKAASSLAVAALDGTDKSDVYEGYYVDANDDSVFNSRDEVDEYRDLISGK